LEVTLDVSLPPERAALLAEDRSREIAARGKVIEEGLRFEAGCLCGFDGREGRFPSKYQPTNGLQKPVLGPRTIQEERRRRHPARVRLFHEIREPVQLLRVPPQVLQDFDVAFQRFGHEDFSSFCPGQRRRARWECVFAATSYSYRNMFKKRWV
jgi:hypothetical protein